MLGLVMLVGALLPYARANQVDAVAGIEPLKDIAINVNRHLQSEDGSVLLFIRTGIWKPHGDLYLRNEQILNHFEGFQQGTHLELNTYDAERGLEAEPIFSMTGQLDVLNNQIQMQMLDNRTGQMRKVKFVPYIPVPDRPRVKLRLLGFREPDGWHRLLLKRIEITDALSGKLMQVLNGENAEQTSYVDYEDINFDGYFDLRVMNRFNDGMNSTYLYWLYNPRNKQFERAPEYEAITGYVNTVFWCKELRFTEATYSWRTGSMQPAQMCDAWRE